MKNAAPENAGRNATNSNDWMVVSVASRCYSEQLPHSLPDKRMATPIFYIQLYSLEAAYTCIHKINIIGRHCRIVSAVFFRFQMVASQVEKELQTRLCTYRCLL